MHLTIIIPVVLVMIALRFVRRLTMLAWVCVWWVGLFIILTYGIEPPMPASVLGMYMFIISVALFAYVASDKKRSEEVSRPVKQFLTEKKYNTALIASIVILSGLIGFKTYSSKHQEITPPYTGRTIHPAPPGKMDFKGKNIDLIHAVNPYRELESTDPDNFAKHVVNGRKIYYENCFFCHGDNLDGRGMVAHGLDPLPANFQDTGTIAQLQESFLFWRIAKGGPGLPEESTPWSSSMPAWENFLNEDEIWDVILFLYDFTGHRPRAREEGEHE